MGLILLEALLALVVLVAIVWWTMFSGRRRGEWVPPPTDAADPAPEDLAEPDEPVTPQLPGPGPRPPAGPPPPP